MVALIASLIASICITGLLIRYRHWHLRFTGDDDLSGPQKFHHEITPRIGGIGIFMGFTTGLITEIFLNGQIVFALFLITLASLPLFIVGIVEDITKRVGVKFRLLAAFISALIFLYFFEINSIHLDIPYVDTLLSHSWVAIIFLGFAITGLSNAYNIIDGFNGLASMVATMSATAILYTAFKVQDPLVMVIAYITIGATLGFFVWNFPRGLIFLGDGGAYFMGFLIAVASVLLVVRNPSVSPWFALMVNSYPVFETLFTIWRRAVHQGRNPGMPDGAHFHSLIYRRIMRWAYHGEKHEAYLGNAKTSPYLWILSSLGILPAILWWDSTISLMLASLGFIIFYVYVYSKIVSFQTPSWISKPPLRDR